MEQAFVRVHGDLAQGQMPTENYIKKRGRAFIFLLDIFPPLSTMSPYSQEKGKAGTRLSFDDT